MGDLRISDVVETTRLSARYWQRRAAMGEIPGVASKFSLIIQRGFVFLDVPFARFAPFAMDKTWDEALSRAPLWRSSLAPLFDNPKIEIFLDVRDGALFRIVPRC